MLSCRHRAHESSGRWRLHRGFAIFVAMMVAAGVLSILGNLVVRSVTLAPAPAPAPSLGPAPLPGLAPSPVPRCVSRPSPGSGPGSGPGPNHQPRPRPYPLPLPLPPTKVAVFASNAGTYSQRLGMIVEEVPLSTASSLASP